MPPEVVGARPDDDPLARFRNALPDHVRYVVPTDDRVIVAVGKLARAGVDLTEIAATCGRGTERRPRNDRRRMALHRLLRAAEQLETSP